MGNGRLLQNLSVKKQRLSQNLINVANEGVAEPKQRKGSRPLARVVAV